MLQVDRDLPADADRVVHGETIVEIGVTGERPDLHRAGALRGQRRRRGERGRRDESNGTSHHANPPSVRASW